MTVVYIPDFIPSARAGKMFYELWDELNWERREDAPRREYWTNTFDRDYTYGRGAGIRTYKAQELHRSIKEVSDALAAHTDVAVEFEGCFLNGYETSRDWLGWHADDDPGIDHSKPIAIVTLYGGEGVHTPRAIQFRQLVSFNEATNEKTWSEPQEVALEQGSLCLMPAGFQDGNQHRIPKAGFNSRSRISLTFRALIA
jgi:hypothetical protein